MLAPRLQGFIDLAKHNPYSNSELTVLLEILSGYFYRDCDNAVYAELYRDLHSLTVSGTIVEVVPGSTNEDNKFVDLNFMQYLLVNYSKAFLFITLVTLENVPLYLSDSLLAPFANWRLSISR
jgi:hypothetical protein